MEEKKALNQEQEQLISGGSAESVSGGSVTCPRCGSLNVKRDQPKKGNAMRCSTKFLCLDCDYYWDEAHRE